MEDAYYQNKEDVLKFFGVSQQTGLSLQEVKENLEKYGPNGKH